MLEENDVGNDSADDAQDGGGGAGNDADDAANHHAVEGMANINTDELLAEKRIP